MTGSDNEAASKRFIGLLDYVNALIKLDERVPLRLSQHKLPNGSSVVLHEHELSKLPGITLNKADYEGPVWLRAQRLQRSAPPAPPEETVQWIESSDDPGIPPSLHETVHERVSASVKEQLIAEGMLRPSDCSPALKPASDKDDESYFDVFYRLEDRPDVQLTCSDYMKETWQIWADREFPRRLSIQAYQRLFDLAQRMSLSGGSESIELVWGVGVSRWNKGMLSVEIPLIELGVELEIADDKGADVIIRPRNLPPRFDLTAFDKLAEEQVGAAEQICGRQLKIIERDEPEGISPFRAESFSSVLKLCGGALDPECEYLPETHKVPKNQPLPEPPEDRLVVSDRWVVYARRRSINATLRDIQRLKDEVAPEEGGGVKLAGAARTLIMGARDDRERDYEPLGTTLGARDTVSAEVNQEQLDPDHSDLFFPKAFNDDQVQIVRRLEKADGIVVQGPPGTGKTHTIANIISHMLATGQRVLVVSHGETALKVIRDHLPEGIRDLAISVTTSEREGTKQIEKAVQLMLEIVNTVDANLSKQKTIISQLSSNIVKDRQQLKSIDRKLDALASLHFGVIPGSSYNAFELATKLVAEKDRHGWFTDRPKVNFESSGLTRQMVDLIADARKRAGSDLEFVDVELPSPDLLPAAAELGGWHLDLLEADNLVASQPNHQAMMIKRIVASVGMSRAHEMATAFEDLVVSVRAYGSAPWALEIVRRQVAGDARMRRVNPTLYEFQRDMRNFLKNYQSFLARPVQYPPELADRAADKIWIALCEGKNPFGLMAFGNRSFKTPFEQVRVAGRPPATTDEWKHALRFVTLRRELPAIRARWHALRDLMEIPPSIDFAEDSPPQLETLLGLLENLSTEIPTKTSKATKYLTEALRNPGDAAKIMADNGSINDFSETLSRTVRAARLNEARETIAKLTGLLARDVRCLTEGRLVLDERLGCAQFSAEQVEKEWSAFLATLNRIRMLALSFEAIVHGARAIAQAGAPNWAERLKTEPAVGERDPCFPSDWTDSWDWATSIAFLERSGSVKQIESLNRERSDIEKRLRDSFAKLVKERTFYNLTRTMTNAHKTALGIFANIIKRIGAGTGNRANLFRRDAREAMENCYDAVPCWIMPAWRVSEQLPSKLASFDLVILDEASQSDARDLPAILRGKKLLVVGDDKQISPTAAFISLANIRRLRNNFLSEMPYRAQVEPGGSLYDLARVMFPGNFVMLKEHFRCVESIIRFSTNFYTQPLIPLRVPTASERLDPPLIDILVQDGKRRGKSKINDREAEVIVEEITSIISDPSQARNPETQKPRTIGVISLIGGHQAALIQKMLLDRIGEVAFIHHGIVCGDSATLQGNERDIVFLSMVADPSNRYAQTAEQYAQRFNVALSRARDRMYLVRSVELDTLNPRDLKARVIQHFRDPMPASAQKASNLIELCQSGFERDLFTRLTEHGYKVTPQVGSEGFFIDLVVEGDGGRRLAIECDGDQYHGPERWADDMRRQRILERVGWTFWRCFGSDYIIDNDGVVGDLLTTLEQMGIRPIGGQIEPYRYTEHRVVGEPIESLPADDNANAANLGSGAGLAIGDRVVIKFVDRDSQRPLSYAIGEGQSDEQNGYLSINSELARALSRAEPEEEITAELEGQERRFIFMVHEPAVMEAA
ncbi:AAA domain-containing protein [Bradyrhizobium canariense]|uniref:AAA domain-containing protein n=1 Tax=Bradyrhizobium canariense TaxID=255045 RepID=UPI001FCD0ADF|nr:AAA domain-containing protein [Bradyrhizobium canariense]